MPSYKAICNKEQLAVISTACEVYARLMLGQFNTILHNVLPYVEIPTERYHDIQDALDEAGKKVWYGTGGSPGIHNPVLPDHARVAWDIHAVIRHLLAFQANPEGGFGVNFDEPHQASKQPLLEVTPTEDVPDPRPIKERLRDELVALLNCPPEDFQTAVERIRQWKECYERHNP